MPRILSGLGERGREAYLTDRLSSLLGPLHSVAFPPEPVMDLLHGACQGGGVHSPPPPPRPPTPSRPHESPTIISFYPWQGTNRPPKQLAATSSLLPPFFLSPA